MDFRFAHAAPLAILSIALAAMVGCSDDGDDNSAGDDDDSPGAPEVGVDGSLEGDAAPDSGAVFVVWGVSAPGSDYLYKYGEGSSNGASFSLDLDAAPPTEALNAAALGIGGFALFPTGTEIPDGRLEDEDLVFDTVLGYSGRFALIYRAAGTELTEWAAEFPDGYSCGRCVDATDDGFDSWEPVDCAEVEIQVSESFEDEPLCNWT